MATPTDRTQLADILARLRVFRPGGQSLEACVDAIADHLDREAALRELDEMWTNTCGWTAPENSESGMAELHMNGAQVSAGYRRGVLRVVVDTSGCPADDDCEVALEVDVEDVTVYSRHGQVGDVRDSVVDENGDWRTCDLHGGAITQDCQCHTLVGTGRLDAAAALLYRRGAGGIAVPWEDLPDVARAEWLSQAVEAVRAYHQV